MQYLANIYVGYMLMIMVMLVVILVEQLNTYLKCNIFSQGNIWIYGNKLKAEIGEEKLDKIIQLSRTTIKTTEHEYKILIKVYTEKLKKLTM